MENRALGLSNQSQERDFQIGSGLGRTQTGKFCWLGNGTAVGNQASKILSAQPVQLIRRLDQTASKMNHIDSTSIKRLSFVATASISREFSYLEKNDRSKSPHQHISFRLIHRMGSGDQLEVTATRASSRHPRAGFSYPNTRNES